MTFHSYIPADVAITKVPGTNAYNIRVEMHDGQRFSGALTLGVDGWLLHAPGMQHPIGRQRHFADALHAALVFIGRRFTTQQEA